MLILSILMELTSFMGFSVITKDKLNLRTYFIPFLYFTSLSSFVYILALANQMLVGVYLFHLIFAILCAGYLIKKRGTFLELREYIIFFLIAILIIIYLYNKKFIHYDDFSHWGLISKFILENDRLNGSYDKIISFKSYPQMSVYFIYGLVRPLGFRENLALIANAFAILSGYYVIFEKARNNKFLYPVLFIFISYIFMNSPQITTLLVDTLLATSGFAILAYATTYDFSEEKKYLYACIPMIISLTLLKNSAIFFVLILLIYLYKRYAKIDKVIPAIGTLVFLFAKISWNLHLKLNFTNLGKHNMSLKNYSEILLEKDTSIIIQISRKFLESFLSERFVLILLVILIVSYFINKRDKKIKKIFIFVLTTYFLYQVGNYFMYIFSMPTSEALEIAGYSRYVLTIRIYLVLISFYWLEFETDMLTAFAISIFMIYSSMGSIKNIIEDVDITPRLEKRKRLEELQVANFKDKNILIKMKEADSSYYYSFMAKYLYQTDKISITYPGDDKNFNEEEFDYVVEE